MASACTVSRATVRLTLKRSDDRFRDGNCLSGAEAAGDDLGGEHVESCCAEPRGSCSSRATEVKSVDTGLRRHQLKVGEMPDEQLLRESRESEPAGWRRRGRARARRARTRMSLAHAL